LKKGAMEEFERVFCKTVERRLSLIDNKVVRGDA